jgi:L-lactate dehydrogenase (cytochrome)
MARLDRAFNVEEMRLLAKGKLPKFIFDYLDGGADDEWVLKNNRRAFEDYKLLTQVLQDVSEVDLSTRILGLETDAPFVLSSTGASRFFHPEGEVAVARAAAAENVLYGIAASAMSSIEEVATAAPGPRFFQVYVFRDRGLNSEFVQRSKAGGYQAMYLTVDSVVAGNRERDLRNQLSIPPKITPQTIWQAGTRPKWVMDYLLNSPWSFPNVESVLDEKTKADFASVAEWFGSQLDRTFTWDDAAELIAEWDGPFVIKGITRPEDAIRAAEIGATGIVVSNHGGRQLDRLPSALDLLPAIVDAVGDNLEVFIDSGFRRGTDIITALALGAKAVSIGRPYLYGLAAGGEQGVSRVVQLLKAEIARDMTMMGVTRIDQITEDLLFKRSGSKLG